MSNNTHFTKNLTKFFKRNFDKKQLSESVRKSIWEISLIVLSILIAFSIDRWNESKKKESVIDAIILEVQEDVLECLQNMDELIVQSSKRDSLIGLFLSDTLTSEHLKSNPNYLNLVFSYECLIYSSDGFNKLKSFQEDIPDKHDSLYVDIKNFFRGVENFDKVCEQLIAMETKNNDYFVLNHAWFSYLYSGSPFLKEKIYKDILSDSIYRNMVYQYLHVMDDCNWIVAKNVGLKTYDLLIESTNNLDVPLKYKELMDLDLTQYVGTYQWKDLNIKSQYGDLKITFEKDHLDYNSMADLEIVAKDSFALYYNNTLFFNRNSIGEIIGATRYYRGSFYELEKIE